MSSTPGEHKSVVRLTDVARLAGVSPGLVSRIHNGDPNLRVRDETRQNVEQAIRLLNYVPNSSARALRNSETGVLGFALHHVNDPIYAEMVNSAQHTAAERNYSIIMLDSASLAERGAALREITLGRRIDGLLVQTGFGEMEETLLDLARSLPSVLFNADETPGMRSLRLDDTQAARIATQHLLDAGHTAIRFMGASGASSERRFAGYQSAMADAGLVAFAPVHGGWSPDEARASTIQLIESKLPVTAIVAVTTTIALGIHSGIWSMGLGIPDDLSLICIHDAWFAAHLNPPMSAVALPLPALGDLAVSMLIEQRRSPTTGETVVREPAPKLVIRGSTSPPPGPDNLERARRKRTMASHDPVG
jgi:LacI family transcriptional regulator